MVGQDFLTFSTICGMEGKTELFVLGLPFYSKDVAFVSFYTVLTGKRSNQITPPFYIMSQGSQSVQFSYAITLHSKASFMPHSGSLCSLPYTILLLIYKELEHEMFGLLDLCLAS